MEKKSSNADIREVKMLNITKSWESLINLELFFSAISIKQ